MEFNEQFILRSAMNKNENDFEKLFTSSFGNFDNNYQFDALFLCSEQLFSRASSLIEEAEGWGVSDWTEASSWTVTRMVDILSTDCNGDDIDEDCDRDIGNVRQRKIRVCNCYRYKFEDILTAPFYTSFLAPDIRARTHRLGTEDRFGQFHAWFCLPPDGYLHDTRRVRGHTILQTKAKLIVLTCLNVLAHGTPFRCLTLNTHISASNHRLYFLKFVEMFSKHRKEYIHLPENHDQLQEVMGRYQDVGLSGAMGSIDVVHCKWSNCPAGNRNHAKGKEGYPTLAFQCISDYDHRIDGVFGPQWGTRNDKHIVKLNTNVKRIKSGWYKDVEWCYFRRDGTMATDVGAYLISDNGYLRWPITICPFMHAKKTTCEGYFSSNLESVRKDVECVFGILKKRWKILDYRFRHRSMRTCSEIFITCCCLHNIMLDMMERMAMPLRVGRGMPTGTDGIWLGNPTDLMQIEQQTDRELALQWSNCRWRLAEHLKVWNRTANIRNMQQQEEL
jgi:hypothetical protein